jgi:hypothetical protein
VTVSGARAGQTIVLQGYSQNHFGTASFANDSTPVDRSGIADSNGAHTFSDLRPPSNSRFRARVEGCSFASDFPTALLTVRTTLTLRVTRVEKRTYRFSGHAYPARTGGLIVSIYRVIGTACAAGVAPRSCPGEVLISQDRADAVTGQWVRKLVFDKNTPARIRLVLKTGQDSQNAPGRSNARDVSVF